MMKSNQYKILIRIFPIPFSVTFYIYFTQLIISKSYFWKNIVKTFERKNVTVKYVAFCKWQNMKLFYFKSRKKFRLVNYENFDEWRKKNHKKVKSSSARKRLETFSYFVSYLEKRFSFCTILIYFFWLTKFFFLPQPIISDLETRNFFQRFSNTFFNWRFSKKTWKNVLKIAKLKPSIVI